MRKRITGGLGLACLALIAFIFMTGPISAQEAGMRMEIPVSFLAGNTVFPAGTYVVRVDERFRLLQLDGVSASGRMMLAAKSTKRQPAKVESGSLRFQKYGDTYVLRNVWQRDDTNGWVLARSQKENELAKANPAPTATQIAETSN